MSLVKLTATAREIAELTGKTERGVNKKALKEGWQFQDRQGRGGGREYIIAKLPEGIKALFFGRMIEGVGADNSPKPPLKLRGGAESPGGVMKKAAELPALSSLKNWQRECMDARLAFIRLIEQAVANRIGVKEAMATIEEQAKAGTLPEKAARLIPIANKRCGASTGSARTLSVRSLMRWWSDYKNAGGNYAVLAPKDVEKHEMPAWAPHFLKCYQVPQKISVPHALENLVKVLPVGMQMPTEDQAYRFAKKFSRLDIQKGRMSSLSLRNIKGFTRRDVSGFSPLSIALCDGHSFKARVAHPVHGKAFHPEICWVIDAVTRKALGWSVGLAESAQTVADAVRHTVETNGIPAILYTDKGAGNMAKKNTEIATGLFIRLGIDHRTGIPGNSQARGRIERAMQSILIRAAKELPTCTHKSMDKHVARKVYLLTESDVKKKGTSDILPTWRQFLDYIENAFEDYNNRPHSELDRVRDTATGKMRNMSPNECEASFIAQGWERPTVEKEKLDALFRPQMMVTVIRAEVRLFGNIYFAKDLEHYHEERVIVEYDIHNASKVWVRDEEGRMICEALFEANKKSMFPVSEVERASEAREKTRKNLKLRQIADIEAEGRGVIDAGEVPTLIVLPPEVLEYEERVAKRQGSVASGQWSETHPHPNPLPEGEGVKKAKRKTFIDDYEIYVDVLEREKTGDASAYEAQWRKDWEQSQDTNKKVGLIVGDPYCRFEEKGGETVSEAK